MKQILVFVGHTGAGKSTSSRYFSEKYHIPLISFANIGKQFSQELGYARIRECYQAIGLERFSKIFSQYFFLHLSDIFTSHDRIIIDGLYLRSVAANLKLKYNTSFIYIDVPESICHKRVAVRPRLSLDAVAAEYHIKEHMKNELGNEYLIHNADITIDGTQELHAVFDEIEQFILQRHFLFDSCLV